MGPRQGTLGRYMYHHLLHWLNSGQQARCPRSMCLLNTPLSRSVCRMPEFLALTSSPVTATVSPSSLRVRIKKNSEGWMDSYDKGI